MLERYKRVYITEGVKQDKIKSYTNQGLVNKLRKHFDNTVLNVMSESTKKIIAWKKGYKLFSERKSQKIERSSMGLRSNAAE